MAGPPGAPAPRNAATSRDARARRCAPRPRPAAPRAPPRSDFEASARRASPASTDSRSRRSPGAAQARRTGRRLSAYGSRVVSWISRRSRGRSWLPRRGDFWGRRERECRGAPLGSLRDASVARSLARHGVHAGGSLAGKDSLPASSTMSMPLSRSFLRGDGVLRARFGAPVADDFLPAFLLPGLFVMRSTSSRGSRFSRPVDGACVLATITHLTAIRSPTGRGCERAGDELTGSPEAWQNAARIARGAAAWSHERSRAPSRR